MEFEIIFQHVRGETDGDQERSQSGKPVFGTRFEPETSIIQSIIFPFFVSLSSST
jgi:hypothetical protein